MQPAEQHNVDVVLRYFEGCNTGELEDLLPTLADDVIHYFLPETFPTIRGREHLARFWRKYKRTLEPTWRVDQIIGVGDLVVSEWSCRWRPSVTAPWVMSRGTEWYVMRDGVIAEVRASSRSTVPPTANSRTSPTPNAATYRETRSPVIGPALRNVAPSRFEGTR